VTPHLVIVVLALVVVAAGRVDAQPKPLFEDQVRTAPAPQDQRSPVTVPEITVRELNAPTADAAGTGSAADLSAGWGETAAVTIMEALEALPAAPLDPAARRLQVDLLQLPTPESQPPGALLAIRLRRLIDLGEIETAQSLADLAGVVAMRMPVLAPVAASLDLARGQDEEACAVVRNVDEFGAGLGEVNLFCAILRDDPDAALVLSNALGETESLRAQPFAALVAVALDYGQADAIDWTASAQPVDIALADHLGIAVPEEAASAASLAAVERLARDPDRGPSLRAVARTRIEEARGDFTTVGPEASRLRAIADPVERARAIVDLWRDSASPAMRLGYLPQLAPLVATIAPRAGLAAEAPTLAAILIASGQEGAALTWFDMLEAQRQGSRDAADRTAVLMILAGLIDPSRMPPSPAGLFGDADAAWLSAGLAGQEVQLSSPWQRFLQPLPPAAGAAPALATARALVDLGSQDPSVFARGLRVLVAHDHAMDARAIAAKSVIARLHG
jgi:hypothetical protein